MFLNSDLLAIMAFVSQDRAHIFRQRVRQDRSLGPSRNQSVSDSKKGLYVDGVKVTDGENEKIEAFWIDKDDPSQCENKLMVTKSLTIKNGKILDSFCKEKIEGYKCWREYRGTWLSF